MRSITYLVYTKYKIPVVRETLYVIRDSDLLSNIYNTHCNCYDNNNYYQYKHEIGSLGDNIRH